MSAIRWLQVLLKSTALTLLLALLLFGWARTVWAFAQTGHTAGTGDAGSLTAGTESQQRVVMARIDASR
jgi:hypothetical protein